ncbi:Nucleosome assembly protein (NAP) [Penicillium expansum]|nr:Nucleosome assembly protein (NAP) [Penicillium expansum]
MSNDQSLLDRVEMPSIPEAAMKKIAILEEQFSRAEVEQYNGIEKCRVIDEQIANIHTLQCATLPSSWPPLIKKRSEIINIPDVQAEFWMRVDAQVLGESLKNMNVERFELDAQGNGEPRSLRFTFEFKTGEENPFFTNDKLVKEFYWRQEVSKNAAGKSRTWEGLVSEPVRINWKKDTDLTKGMLDAACDLAEAEKKKGGDRKKLPEFAALVKKVEEAQAEADAEDDEDDEDPSPVGMSFFGFFGYRGRDVSAAQSKEAAKEIEARWAKIQNGEDVEDADDLAVAIAEDLWPEALSYYVQSFQIGEELEDMDLDMEEMDGDDSDEESESRPRKKARN